MPIPLTHQVYNVPVVPNDLRKEETIKHIADALEYLENITDDVFKRISDQVSGKKQELNKLNDRLCLVQAKLNILKGSSKATKIFASAKYPVTECNFSEALFKHESTLSHLQRSNYHIRSKLTKVDDKILKDKCDFYNVNVKYGKKETEDQGEGLGALPKIIPSVSSLLLFNTSENPYKKYVILDPLGVVTKTRTVLEKEAEEMAAAPSSMTHQDDSVRKTESLFYIPNLGEVPEISVPHFLPELQGVADDLSYSADLGPSIAPSMFGGNIPDLPEVVPTDEVAVETLNGISNSVPSLPETLPQIVPKPPSPPPIPMSMASSNVPIPPPINVTITSSTPEVKPESSSVPESTSIPVSNDRQDLLKSIRAAGGIKKLRSVKDRKVSKKQKQREKAVSDADDHVKALANKLAMRRKGISGDRSDSPAKLNSSAMEKVSAMIPHVNQQAESNSDDDDWQD